MKKWKFKPAVCGAEPVVSEVDAVASFRIQSVDGGAHAMNAAAMKAIRGSNFDAAMCGTQSFIPENNAVVGVRIQ
jgi:hypothetical protein